MPPRLVVVAVGLFWLASTGLLFQREIWPKLRPGDPPAFTIDLAYEAQSQASVTTWRVLRNKQRIGMVHTWISYDQDSDLFDLNSEIKELDLGDVGPLHVWIEDILPRNTLPEKQRPMRGTYRVTREGELRSLKIDLPLRIGTGNAVKDLALKTRIEVEGRVEGKEFKASGHVEFAGQRHAFELPTITLRARPNILNPLHPVNRIAGLRPGQHWTMTVMDPLADSLTELAARDPALELLIRKSRSAETIDAEVLPEVENLAWETARVPCLVIEYHSSDNAAARTWVRASDGLVIQQEASFWGEKLVLKRL